MALSNQRGGSIVGGVVLGNFANQVSLQIGSTITGTLNLGTSTAATLTLTDDGTGGTQTYSGAVSGATTFAGALTKAGSGTWIIDQPLGSTGSTTIRAGTFSLSTGRIASAAVNVQDSGILTLGNATALSDVSTFSLVAVTRLNLDGSIGTSETIAVLLLNGTAVTPGTYTVAQLAALSYGTGIGFGSANGEIITVTAVPEPSTWALLGVGAIGLGVVARRRHLATGK